MKWDQVNACINKVIGEYTRKGYRVQSQSDLFIQMVREKNKHIWAIIILLLLGILPGIIYLLIPNRIHTVSIRVCEDGLEIARDKHRYHLKTWEELGIEGS